MADHPGFDSDEQFADHVAALEAERDRLKQQGNDRAKEVDAELKKLGAGTSRKKSAAKAGE